MSKHYDEKKVLRELAKKNVQCDFSSHKLIVNTNKTTIGISSWGKIDFLVKYCGWQCITSKEKAIVATTEDSENKNYKESKKEAKSQMRSKKQNVSKENNSKGFLKKLTSNSSKDMFKTLKRIKK